MIIDASETHVVLKKFCQQYPYRNNRAYMCNDFFLYDLETGSMRTIWSASTQAIGSPAPDAIPVPSVQKVNDGYRYDWTGLFPSDNIPSKMEIHNLYLRKKSVTGENHLTCIDTTAQKNRGTENEMCEGSLFKQ